MPDKQLLINGFLIAIVFITSIAELAAYPIDGYLRTGIKRLLLLQKQHTGEMKGKKLISGALQSQEALHLNLYGSHRGKDLHDLPEIDPELDKALDELFPGRLSGYSVALMDISPGRPVRYAARQEERQYQPGSVGKLAVLTAFFCELSNIYPDDFEKRVELLKNRRVLAGPWALSDHHRVTVFDIENSSYNRRQVTAKDVFTLYEWIDYMLSVSNNGAASIVWREAILMREFGADYPTLTQETADNYFKTTNRKFLSDQAENVVNEPLRALNITTDEWRLGTLFTRGASGIIPPQGGSTGTPKGLMKWMLALERGNIVDPASSLEMKRLMYMTDRRIRYGSNKELKDAAIYFKSGSFYKCDRNRDPNCKPYAGNVYNYMNSVAIVERPDETVYMIALMTNVLNKNSAYDHNRLAGKVDELFIEQGDCDLSDKQVQFEIKESSNEEEEEGLIEGEID